jgi:hypothetical protein
MKPGENPRRPKYVRVAGSDTCLRSIGNKRYHRDAGDWSVGSCWLDGDLFVVVQDGSPCFHMNGLLLEEVDRQTWMKSNEGYV